MKELAHTPMQGAAQEDPSTACSTCPLRGVKISPFLRVRGKALMAFGVALLLSAAGARLFLTPNTCGASGDPYIH
jgi:hypothetical protein